MTLRKIISEALSGSTLNFKEELKAHINNRIQLRVDEASRYKNLYSMPENDFTDKYNRYKKVRNGIVTHVYDDKNEIASYNHLMNYLSTNQTHEGYKNVD